MPTPEAAYRRVREAAGTWDESGRARIRLAGKDRVKFLQNMTTADVAALGTGETAHACALTVKAKLVAEFRIHALADALLLDVERDRAAPLLDHLRKFVVINKVEFEDLTDATGALAVEGPRARDLLDRALRRIGAEGAPEVWIARASLSGETGFRVYAARTRALATLEALAVEAGGAPPLPPEVVESLRIENGVPRWGLELGEETFPPETGLERWAISATKGCYLGQEPIARLHFRGHVNRHLTGLVLPEDAAIPLPDTRLFSADGKEVGRVTSGTRSIALGRPIALAYARREALAPGTALHAVRPPGEEGAVPCEVRDLPLVAPSAPSAPGAGPVRARPTEGPSPSARPGQSGPAPIMPGGAPS